MKSTKRALVASVLSMILCVMMLVGTTFAWFTTRIESGVNELLAGNLAVELAYSHDMNTWTQVTSSTTGLFKDKTGTAMFWEPGATCVVYLKVTNKGGLAAKYDLMLNIAEETQGTSILTDANNVHRPFKLSDYILCGAANVTEAYTNGAAAAAVARTKLSEQDGAILIRGNVPNNNQGETLALVLHMPEDTDDIANYMPGNDEQYKPTLKLKLKFVATQLASEVDSFDKNYDRDAFYPTIPAYETTVTASANGDTTIKNSDNTLEITVPSVAATSGATLTMKVKPTAAPTGIAVNNADTRVAAYDIHVDGLASNNEALVTVKLYIGKGLTDVTLYHNNAPMTLITSEPQSNNQYKYDAATGYVTFATKSFSPFTVTYKVPAAIIGTQGYSTLSAAFAAVKPGETITLLKNSSGDGIVVPENSNFTVNFNGFTYTVNTDQLAGSSGTKNQCFQLLQGSTLTFKNGAIVADNAGVKMIIQNYCNLTLDNMNIDATKGTNNVGYVVSNNCGTVRINGSTIVAKTGGIAFDSCKFSSYSIPTVTVTNSAITGNVELTGGKLIATSGTLEGEIVTGTGYPDDNLTNTADWPVNGATPTT